MAAGALLATISAVLLGALAPAPASAVLGAAEPSVACRFTDDRLTEMSGLAASLLHPGVLWTHNDSGGGAVLYAVDTRSCAVRATLTLADTPGRDIEAIATGRDAEGNAVIWVGDIGDNEAQHDYLRLHQVLEPEVLADATVGDRTWRFVYGDGAHDAETLLADPTKPKLWVVTKELTGAGVYALPDLPDVDEGGTVETPLVARRVAPAPSVVTDGSVSPDGTQVVLRGYLTGRLYAELPPKTAVATVPLPAQRQGEAIAFSANGKGLWAVGEGEDALWRVPLPQVAASASPTPSASASSGSAATSAAGPVAGATRSDDVLRWVLVGLLAGCAAVIAVAASRRFRVG